MADKPRSDAPVFDQRGQRVGGPQVNIAGDAAGPITISDAGASTDEIARAFAPVEEKVKAMPAGPPRDDAGAAVEKLKAEAGKGDQAEESTVRRWLNFLAEAAPDAWEVAINTMINPIAGVSTVFKKIAERAKAEKAARQPAR